MLNGTAALLWDHVRLGFKEASIRMGQNEAKGFNSLHKVGGSWLPEAKLQKLP